MESALPPLLLLVLLLVNLGGGPVPTLAQVCDSTDFVLKEGDKRVISDELIGGGDYRLYMYVKPQDGFEGFGLIVTETAGNKTDAWFPADPNCFPSSEVWYEMWGRATIQTNTIRFDYWIGQCWKECMKDYSHQSFRGFSVVAYGPSEWLLEKKPPTCEAISWSYSPYATTMPTCYKLPPNEIPTTLIAATAAGAVVVVVAASVAVLVVCLRRKPISSTTGEPASPTQPTEPATELHTIVNELYEPFDKYGAIANTTHEKALYVMENELYEPFSGYGYDQKTTPEDTCTDKGT